MDRVLFGDNQFFGINHMSEEKARAQAIRFQDMGAILSVIDDAYSAGIRVFMCTTHDRIADVCAHVRNNRAKYAGFKFYPCMPYAHKYANAVTADGPVGALKRFLPEEGAFGAMMKGGLAAASGDIETIGRLLIDAEMKMFRDLDTPVVFLQNIATDLLLGLGAYEAFRIFADHVSSQYGAEPGFITMNLPALLDALEKVDISNPIVCSTINKAGFRMSGGTRMYEEALATKTFRPVAMSVLASGAIPPREAIEYVCRLPKIESIVFGASSESNIRQTKRLIDEFSAGPVTAN